MDDPAEDVGVSAAVVVGRTGLGHERGGEEIAGRVAGVIGVVVGPAVGVPCGHAEQVGDGDLLAARRRGVGQVGQVHQHRVIQGKRAVALEQADGQ